MSKPQQPEIGRSRRTPSQDPDSAATVIQGSRPVEDDGPRGPVPPDNQPGHHPTREQDRPDLGAFAERLGTAPGEPAAGQSPAGQTGAGASGQTGGEVGAGASDQTLGEVGADDAARAIPGRAAVRRVGCVLLCALAVVVLARAVRRRMCSA